MQRHGIAGTDLVHNQLDIFRVDATLVTDDFIIRYRLKGRHLIFLSLCSGGGALLSELGRKTDLALVDLVVRVVRNSV